MEHGLCPACIQRHNQKESKTKKEQKMSQDKVKCIRERKIRESIKEDLEQYVLKEQIAA